MYYKVKVYSAKDSTKRNDFFVKETLPYVDRKVLEEFFQKATCYQVKVTPLPHVTQLKKKYKVWDSIDLEYHIRTIKFYTLKEHEVNDWVGIATFYKEKPFDIEVSNYMGVDYTFFKRPGKYTTSIIETLVDTIDPCSNILGTIRLSKYDDLFVIGKYAWSYDGFGHVHLNKLIGTHTECVREELVL